VPWRCRSSGTVPRWPHGSSLTPPPNHAGASTTERADLPSRDDSEWGYHLNLRKGLDGEDGVPQAPRVAPVFLYRSRSWDGLPPTDQTVHQVEQPPLVGGKSPGQRRDPESPSAVHPHSSRPSPRIAEVLALEEPTICRPGSRI